ncbi:MyoD family inhibitor domain-containing protein I-mfa domain-containing protein [Triplophysa tibetana]|uniref:MyoD family inhibitor domain-containing protein I-mfa domain-containing protein n=1 Tax=Triplophysa tibetana TaxID=1572043 RepID=A0A5A9PHL5_9TELE|nr:MyoD family inhibitor domain-containing protein I-mfa domain-containing protein [Triplophysa tibetana]
MSGAISSLELSALTCAAVLCGPRAASRVQGQVNGSSAGTRVMGGDSTARGDGGRIRIESSNINFPSPNKSSEPALVLRVFQQSKSQHSGHYSSPEGFRRGDFCPDKSLDNSPPLAQRATWHGPEHLNYTPHKRGNSKPLSKTAEQMHKQSKNTASEVARNDEGSYVGKQIPQHSMQISRQSEDSQQASMMPQSMSHGQLQSSPRSSAQQQQQQASDVQVPHEA